jgi:hypothetical protein
MASSSDRRYSLRPKAEFCRTSRHHVPEYSNFQEVDVIIPKFTPASLCLQETQLALNRELSFHRYTTYHDSITGDRAHVGVRDNAYSTQISLLSTLQTSAVRLVLTNVTVTELNILFLPNEPW